MRPVGKHALLSAEVSRARALLAGGGAGAQVLGCLREWVLRAPLRGSRRVSASLLHWSEQLCAAIRDALPLGAPVGVLLREVQPMIRREERHWTRLQGVERQFAFQGAIAVVLPWGVASLSGGITVNLFTAAGLFFQLAGLALFYVVLRHAMRRVKEEQAEVFDLITAVWMRALAGMALHAALESSLRGMRASKFRTDWERWLMAYHGGAADLGSYEWPEELPLSRDLALLMMTLLRSGSPAAGTLADCISQLDDDRQAALEERLAGVPTRLSLVFCGFLTPAVFLILMGGLWPTLKDLSI